MAFCWAVEPSAVSEVLPPQSAADADELCPTRRSSEDVPALLSLPHAVSVKAATRHGRQATASGVPTLLPKRLSFTDPTFG